MPKNKSPKNRKNFYVTLVLVFLALGCLVMSALSSFHIVPADRAFIYGTWEAVDREWVVKIEKAPLPWQLKVTANQDEPLYVNYDPSSEFTLPDGTLTFEFTSAEKRLYLESAEQDITYLGIGDIQRYPLKYSTSATEIIEVNRKKEGEEEQ